MQRTANGEVGTPSPPSVRETAKVPFELTIFPTEEAFEVGRETTIPFTISNHGSAPDRYKLSAGFPAEFDVTFAAVGKPKVSMTKTPPVAPQETFQGILKLRLPGKSIDGQKFAAPLSAQSQRSENATITRQVRLEAAAPLLRSVLKSHKSRVSPGETIDYRLTIMNVGSVAARKVSIRLFCSSPLEPIEPGLGGFTRETNGSLVQAGIGLGTGEMREFAMTFRVHENVAAGEKLTCRLETENQLLGTNSSVTEGSVVVNGLR